MAAAEARAAWQRTANRCFVQEDAKRAPKLGCCPSSSSSSTQQFDSSNDSSTNEREHPTSNFAHLTWSSINTTLPPETRWWLQLQPNFGSQKDFTSGHQLNAPGEKLEERVQPIAPSSKPMVSTAFMKQDFETRADGMKTVTNVSQQPLKRKLDMEDYFFKDEELMGWEPVERLISRKTDKISLDLGSPWAGGNNSEPWWHISDQDELASLVAQKSLERIENCDLPRPAQTVPVSRIFSPSRNCKSHTSMCDPIGYPQYSSTSGSLDEKYWLSGESGYPPKDTEKLHSTTGTNRDRRDIMPASETNSSRDQLLDALRHSQTRAREAEMAAQKAYSEKEHILKLFFKQASQLFAYKQWLHMLQLETLCLQLKINNQQISTLLPDLPWMPLRRNKTNSKGKKKHKKCGICKYGVGFFVGLGLASAGLLLGWTLGWLFPYL